MSVAHIPRPSDARSSFLSRHLAKLWIGAAIALVIVLIAGFSFVRANWPYRYRKIHPLLEDVLASQVKISSYHRIYFPNPGFVATGLTLRRKSAPDLPPLGSADRMVVYGRWSDLLLLRQRVQIVEVTHLHIVVPPIGSRANHEDFPPGSSSDFSGPDTAIEDLHIRDSLLDIMRKDGGRYSFPIYQLHIRNFEKDKAFHYEVDMQNAKPRGRIQATGSFGPLAVKDVAATPLSGKFTFTSVALTDLGDIGGTLASSGHFKGTLAAMEAAANSNTPDFAVDGGKSTPIAASIQCTVNGINGDVTIHAIEARTGATSAHAVGSIAGSPKVTNFDINVEDGRAQDVLRPFMRKEVPIAGPVWLHAHAYIGPTGRPFLKRLRVDGAFDVPTERLTNQATQKSLSDFSHRAQGNKPTDSNDLLEPKEGESSSASSVDALSSVKGPAQIRDGIVSSPRIVFQVPGAEADLSGTFVIHGETVHLLGDLKMHADISHATTGFKSFLLKPLAPFFKKKPAGAVIPIAVRGSPGHYKVNQNIMHSK